MARLIKHVYSNNEKYGSKLISWGTKHGNQKMKMVPSHYSVLFFDMMIVESTMTTGVRINYWPTFKKKNKIITIFEEVPPANYANLTKEQKMQMSGRDKFAKLLDRVHGKLYDYLGILYFGLRVLKWKLFKDPIPTPEKGVNKWNKKGRFFCTEVYNELHDGDQDMSMADPNSLLELMSAKPEKFREMTYGEWEAIA